MRWAGVPFDDVTTILWSLFCWVIVIVAEVVVVEDLGDWRVVKVDLKYPTKSELPSCESWWEISKKKVIIQFVVKVNLKYQKNNNSICCVSCSEISKIIFHLKYEKSYFNCLLRNYKNKTILQKNKLLIR